MKKREHCRRLTSKQWSLSAVELVTVCAVGMGLIFFGMQCGAPSVGVSQPAVMAGEIMQTATELIASYREESGPPIDFSTDINGTGLIGSFFSPMTTTLGNLEAKRTSTNPNMAGLLVDLLLKAGVTSGDFIAVGASGSFPALLLATAAAACALDVRVGLILSLGSSQFGANIPQFTWIDMERVLAGEHLLSLVPVALSYGGDLDIARDLDASTRELLQAKIDESGAIHIHNPSLSDNVRQRMAIYREASGKQGIAAFVNIGGAWANMGMDASILTLAPGVIRLDDLPDHESRGVIHEMIAGGVPVIHLLNMRGLVQRYGLPWDPSPLPQPGENLAVDTGDRTSRIWFSVFYLAGIALWLGTVAARRRRCNKTAIVNRDV